jgi:phage head maturation protease
VNFDDCVRGYAVVYNAWSRPITEGDATFRERICAGVLRIAGAEIAATVDHHSRTLFASTINRSLRLRQDAYGLAFAADLPADSSGAGVRFCVASGRRCSVGLIVHRDEWGHDGEMPLRTVTSAGIDHITVCFSDDVAYSGTGAWLASEESRLPPHYRALAQRWGHDGDSSRPTASARGRFIIPESEMRIAARLAQFGRRA